MKIFVAGHQGMVGKALIKKLESSKNNKIITASRDELDLIDQKSVMRFFKENEIEEVYLAAAKVGGIHANNYYPGQFIFENLMIQSNVIHSAKCSNVKKLLFLGSSCIYPKYSEQPIKEDALLTGILESTNEPYALAKIAGIKLCESYNRQYDTDFRSVMPTNLYGPNDNFHPENSHVIPAMMSRFHKAVSNGEDEVSIWGSGKPMREFLFVDDMASACIHIMNINKDEFSQYTLPMCSHINVGSGVDYSIRELAEVLAKVTGYKGNFVFDDSRPDGTPKKLLDVTRLASLGWKSSIGLQEGLERTYFWYKKNILSARAV